jgi:hypothetical protein
VSTFILCPSPKTSIGRRLEPIVPADKNNYTQWYEKMYHATYSIFLWQSVLVVV